MRAIIFLTSIAMLTACSNDLLDFTAQDTGPLPVAESFVGLSERSDRKQLRAVLGVDPVRTEWCAAFVNAVLELHSTPNLNDIDYPYPLTARGFLNWGVAVDPKDMQPGDVVVFPRGNQGWQGHVGFYVGVDQNQRWVILGGNQDNTVSYAIFDPAHAVGVRRWQEPLPVVD